METSSNKAVTEESASTAKPLMEGADGPAVPDAMQHPFELLKSKESDVKKRCSLMLSRVSPLAVPTLPPGRNE